MKVKEIFRITSLPVLFASLCCLSPVILVLFGFGTVAIAGSLTDILYGELRWIFRIAGLLLLGASLYVYFTRKKGICTFDEVKRRRNEIINTVLITLVAGVVGYLFFLYVVVHYIGVFLGIWQ